MNHRPTATPRWIPSRLAAILLISSCAAVLPAAAPAAPLGWSVSGGWYSDGIEDFFLGAGARVSLGGITVSPNAEWIFVESGSAYTLNVDGTLPVLPLGVASVYVGGGLGLFTIDPEGGDSDTETGINVIAGAGLNAVPLKPFAQFKYVFLDGDDPMAFSIGARF